MPSGRQPGCREMRSHRTPPPVARRTSPPPLPRATNQAARHCPNQDSPKAACEAASPARGPRRAEPWLRIPPPPLSGPVGRGATRISGGPGRRRSPSPICTPTQQDAARSASLACELRLPRRHHGGIRQRRSAPAVSVHPACQWYPSTPVGLARRLRRDPSTQRRQTASAARPGARARCMTAPSQPRV